MQMSHNLLICIHFEYKILNYESYLSQKISFCHSILHKMLRMDRKHYVLKMWAGGLKCCIASKLYMNKSLCKKHQDIDYRNKNVSLVCVSAAGDLWLRVGGKNNNV